MIKEIHHRVKNSLNTVAGLLRMQMRRSGDEDTKQALKKAVDRILSISQVHDVLAHQSGEDIDWNMLLNKLCDLSVKSLGNRSWELLREELQTSIILNQKKRYIYRLPLTNSFRMPFDMVYQTSRRNTGCKRLDGYGWVTYCYKK